VKLIRGEVVSSESAKQVTLKLGDWVPSGAVIKTADKSFVKLIFLDKSSINIGPNSQMNIEKFSGSEAGVINVVKGMIKSQVTKDHFQKSKEGSKLFIKTPNAVMGIRGTEFTVGVTHKPGFEPVTSVVMIEGEVKFNDIPKGQELSPNQTDMDRFLKDGVAVHGGEATAVNSNNPGQPLVEPFKLSLEQLNKVEKTEIPGMTSAEAKTENHKSILPAGLDATIVASKPDLKETNSPEQSAPNKTLPGSMMDLATGIVLPPKEGAQYDAVTGTFVSTGNAVAKVNPDGSLATPQGMEFSPKGKIIITVEAPESDTQNKGKVVHVEITPPPASQPSKASVEAIGQVFQQNPQLAVQVVQSGNAFSLNQLAPVVAAATASQVQGPKPASEGQTQVAVSPAPAINLATIQPPTNPVNEVYNPQFVGNQGLSDLVNNSTSYNAQTGTGTSSQIIQQNMNTTDVNISIGVGD
jgi:FecR protein